ncbi:hypothetical protein [Kaistella antarctica]|nr:hypothetical protein [Kaistella antarctica]SEV97255.1 hypothetical protein SAMN05421765_1591 [Kaistella antarctica]VEH96398.1 Uncharacterised protein [Kaistella antarctica]
MDKKIIFANQSTIQINIMKVDGIKLSKSLIEQIPVAFPFDNEYNFKGDKIFGFAKTGKSNPSNPNGRWIYSVICEKDGKLIKFDIGRLISIINVKPKTMLDDFSIRAVKEMIGDDSSLFNIEENSLDGVQYNRNSSDYNMEKLLTKDGNNKFFGIINKVKSFYLELQNHQIYI